MISSTLWYRCKNWCNTGRTPLMSQPHALSLGLFPCPRSPKLTHGAVLGEPTRFSGCQAVLDRVARQLRRGAEFQFVHDRVLVKLCGAR